MKKKRKIKRKGRKVIDKRDGRGKKKKKKRIESKIMLIKYEKSQIIVK